MELKAILLPSGAQQAVARAQGTLRARRRERLTLNQFLDQWLAGLLGQAGRTREDYENITRRYWRTTLGALRLDQIAQADVRRELTRLPSQRARAGRASGRVP
jgi:hypothetical protein